MTIDLSIGEPDPAAIQGAMAALDAHFAALNAGDEQALAATLHFPHYRLTGGTMQVWERPESYFVDFRKRAGDDWHHSCWDFRRVIAAGSDKVHLDVQFTRYRADGSAIGRYRSMWVVSKLGGRWAAQLRSSFAA